MKRLKYIAYNERLTLLNQSSVSSRHTRTDLIPLYKILYGLMNFELKAYFFLSDITVHNLRVHAFKFIIPKPRIQIY